MGIPPCIYLFSNIYLEVTNLGEMEKHVVGALKLKLDDYNIRGGYYAVNMMYFQGIITLGEELDIKAGGE